MTLDFAEADRRFDDHRAAHPVARPSNALAAQFRHLADVQPVLSMQYLIKGWLTSGALSMLYGPSNAGKTFVALDMALHVAGGGEWRGNRVSPGPVIYVAAEGGLGIKNRLAALRLEMPNLCANAELYLLPVSLNLHGQMDAKALCEALPVASPALIVIDTLARSMGDGDENTAKDAAAFVKNCDMIREKTGAHVMVIHHTGKDADKGARGSSALRAAVDTEIAITAEREIECRKQRDLAAPDPLHFALKGVTLGFDDDGDEVTSAVVVSADPPKPKEKPLSGTNEVAMQALRDAVEAHGDKKHGDNFPGNRRVVDVSHWRDQCDNHGLTSGVSDSSARTAFMRSKKVLMNKNAIREWGGFVWEVYPNE